MTHRTVRRPTSQRITLTEEQEEQIRALGAAIGLDASARDYLIDRLTSVEIGRGRTIAAIDATSGETQEQTIARDFAVVILSNAHRENNEVVFTPQTLARAFVSYTQSQDSHIDLTDYTNRRTLNLLGRYARRAGVDPDQLRRAFLTYRIISEAPVPEGQAGERLSIQLRDMAGYALDSIASQTRGRYNSTLAALTIACVRSSMTSEERPMFYLRGRRDENQGIFDAQVGDLHIYEVLLTQNNTPEQRIAALNGIAAPTSARRVVPSRVVQRPEPLVRDELEEAAPIFEPNEPVADYRILRPGTLVSTIQVNNRTYTYVVDPELVRELIPADAPVRERRYRGGGRDPVTTVVSQYVQRTDIASFIRSNEPRIRIYRGNIKNSIREFGERTDLAISRRLNRSELVSLQRVISGSGTPINRR